MSVLAAAAVSFTVLSAWVPRMVSYAVGVMLAAAFLHLLPEAFMQADSIEGLFAVLLGGILTFFLFEKAALWRHRHEPGVEHRHAAEHGHRRRAGALIVLGDGFHNFVDGVLIAAAFLIDIRLGITTAAAIVAHEIPQEVGDFMVLLHSGYARRKALLLNLASSVASVVGGLAGYFALEGAQGAIPYVVALAAASFIYIAVADLIPDLHRSNDGCSTAWQVVLIAAGVATVAVPHGLLHPH